MLLADDDVFLYAHRPESPRHDEHRSWLDAALGGVEPLVVSEAVLASFVRIATHRGVYQEPTPTEVALTFCEAVLAAPAAVVLRPGPRHRQLFSSLALAAAAGVAQIRHAPQSSHSCSCSCPCSAASGNATRPP